MSESKKPAVPRPAATVMLLRDGAAGLEVFMVVRHHEIDAFSGALVFPGGKVDPGDCDPGARRLCRGAESLTDADLPPRLAAIREAFEECGVLLAGAEGEDALVGRERLEELLARWREPLLQDTATLPQMCEAEGLWLALDRLVHFAHWIAPAVAPVRFDTHFFLAVPPADHVARHDGNESLESVWVSPTQVLAEADAGRYTLVFPTRMNLRKLARADHVEQAMQTAAAAPVVTVQPDVEPHAEGRILRIPAAADYGASELLVRPDGRIVRILT